MENINQENNIQEKFEVKLDTKKLQEILNILILGTETSAINADKSMSFFFKTIDSVLYIFSSSQNIQISCIYGNINCDLNVCLEAKKLKHVIDKTKKQVISFIKEKEDPIWKLHGVGKYRLQNFSITPPDTFFIDQLKTELFTLSSKEMASAMEKSIFFVNEERQDPHLRNFYFDGNMVATDKKSIQVVKTSLQGSSDIQLLIPQIFYDVCTKLDNPLTVYDQDNYYIVTCGEYRIQLPRIFGAEKFPKYEEFIKIPEAYPDCLTVKRQDFLEALERVTYFTSKDMYFRVFLKITSNKITVIVDEADRVEENINCVSTSQLDLALNAQYLKKALEVFTDEIIEIRYSTFRDVIYLKEETSRLILVPVTMKM